MFHCKREVCPLGQMKAGAGFFCFVLFYKFIFSRGVRVFSVGILILCDPRRLEAYVETLNFKFFDEYSEVEYQLDGLADRS